MVAVCLRMYASLSVPSTPPLLASLSHSAKSWSHSLNTTKPVMEVTLPTRWIHLLCSDLWHPHPPPVKQKYRQLISHFRKIHLKYIPGPYNGSPTWDTLNSERRVLWLIFKLDSFAVVLQLSLFFSVVGQSWWATGHNTAPLPPPDCGRTGERK